MYFSNHTKLNFKKCIATWKLFLENNIPSLTDLQKIRTSIYSYLGLIKHYITYNIAYSAVIKDRNSKLFQYGYVEAQRNKTMIYRLLFEIWESKVKKKQK